MGERPGAETLAWVPLVGALPSQRCRVLGQEVLLRGRGLRCRSMVGSWGRWGSCRLSLSTRTDAGRQGVPAAAKAIGGERGVAALEREGLAVPDSTDVCPGELSAYRATEMHKATETRKTTEIRKATEMCRATEVHKANETRTEAREEQGTGWGTAGCPHAGLPVQGHPALPRHRHPLPPRHGAAFLSITGAGARPRVESVGISSSRRERLASAGPILQDLRLTRCLEKNNPSWISVPLACARVGF